MSFNVAWFLSAAIVLALYAGFGRVSRKSVLGLLIDDRERFSLNHFQMLMWTILVLSTLLAAFISSGFDPIALEVPQELLILLGISLGTGAASAAVKSVKDASGSPADVKRGNPKASQMFMAEEGEQGNKVVNVTKFQNFVFTLVIAAAYVVLTLRTRDYPALPEQVVWLIGISHAGYVTGKVPNARHSLQTVTE